MSVVDTTSTRVAFCVYDTPDGRVGGPIAWALDILPYLKKAGIQVEAITLRHGGEGQGRIAEQCDAHDIPVRYLDTSGSILLEDQVEWILKQCRIHEVKTLVANLVLPAWYAARYLRSSGIRTIGVLHSDPTFDSFYRDLVDHFVADGSLCPDVIVPVSEFVNQIAGSRASHKELSRVVIPCGCQSQNQVAKPPVNELRLVYAGRLVREQKRIKETAEALLTVCETDGVTATIYGDGPEKKSLEQLLEGQSAVRYGGQLAPADLPAALSQQHVMVLLSDYEGLPIALLEGMACGLVPVCLAGTSGVGEVIEDGINGYLVDDRGESFTKAISKLRDPQLWTMLSAAAKATVAARYSHEVTFSKWQQLLTTTSGNVIEHQRIPRRIGRVSRADRFAGYPQNRPGIRAQLVLAAGQWATALRMALRPRARFREIQKYMRGES